MTSSMQQVITVQPGRRQGARINYDIQLAGRRYQVYFACADLALTADAEAALAMLALGAMSTRSELRVEEHLEPGCLGTLGLQEHAEKRGLDGLAQQLVARTKVTGHVINVDAGLVADSLDGHLGRRELNQQMTSGSHHAHRSLGLAQTGLRRDATTRSGSFGVCSRVFSVSGGR